MNLPDPALPPAPERPDCCGGGCAVCVLDGYAEELQRWQQIVEDIRCGKLPPYSPESPS